MATTPLLILLLATVGSVRAYQEAHEIDVNAWNSKVREGVWLIKWYAPWCAHCKKMTPIIEEVAEYYHRRDDKVKIGRVDATAHPGLATPFSIKGYPTLSLLRDGQLLAVYNGPRTFEAITAFVDETANAPPGSAPRAPRSPTTPDGQRRPPRDIVRRVVESVADRVTGWARSVSEIDSLQAGLLVLATAVTMGVGLMVLLVSTTAASARR